MGAGCAALAASALCLGATAAPALGAHPLEPDLVTLLFGYNDWEAGLRGPEYEVVCRDAIRRIRRATGGKADVLLLTTIPAVARQTTMAELAEAARRAAREGNAGLADTEQAFLKEWQTEPERLFSVDKVHLSPAGHEVVVRTVLAAIEGG